MLHCVRGPWTSTSSGVLHSAAHNLTACRHFTDYTWSQPGSTSLSRLWSGSSRPSVLPCNSLRNSWRCHIPDLVSSPQGCLVRPASSSNTRWVNRQKGDHFAREAKVMNLKSRAAFKLLQINERYKLFKPGMTVVDLGFAPGSWSQVAIDLVRPGLGRVVGVDIIPVVPPKGVNGLQGDFLSTATQDRVRDLLRDENAGRARREIVNSSSEVIVDDTSYIDRERAVTSEPESESDSKSGKCDDNTQEHSEYRNRVVDVVLSDMSAPWEIVSGLNYKNSLSNPYYRMMNTSGNKFKDHAGSMDLCRAALYFAHDTLKVGGHFVCKFYQGAEDRQLEKQLKAMFSKVHREKPESSRSESKESFFVCVKRLAGTDKNAIFDEG